ncbi:MAG: alpha/beta fold hydrolase [Pseudomonadales bacterium]|jgi:pimeloyl-ACP methyl ester carboxylesterase|nr:alpha/beta fold hydrolase [Pseudomonadales bacterium]MDP4764991.1 alpha/beta fold hydrolase [Pseudomonadales bacterium]MDP4876219.1 alpha/beta fold hydrolase [Pseudomonadales bacterium]MDP4911216.1 alpha/beta fold hydrolase [Pseudomonadales bacterium]MDP5058024.1 alpha/beta fold hydrolase [Pseudomonadales bacterium]
MASITANSISIEYETFGNPADRPLLLIMGLGAQLTRWPEAFCQLLAARGQYVVRFDNRDVGLSQKFDAAGVPNMAQIFAQAMAGESVSAAYNLSDMASDAAGLLDALGITAAHVCGASMGGMIAQVMALEHGARVKSLTSIMSTTGNPTLPSATPAASAALMSAAGTKLEEVLARAVTVARATGGSAFPVTDAEIRQRAQADFERSFYPVGVARHMAAIAATGNRKPRLQTLVMPTLVLHGKDDPLVPLTGGIDTHEAISGSILKVFEGMGHNLPEPLWPELVLAISDHTEQHH